MKLYLMLMNALRREEGQDLGEYALLFALIAIVVMAAVIVFGENLSGFFAGVADAIAWLDRTERKSRCECSRISRPRSEAESL